MKYVLYLVPIIFTNVLAQNVANRAFPFENATPNSDVWTLDKGNPDRRYSGGNGTESLEDGDKITLASSNSSSSVTSNCVGPDFECVPYYLCDNNDTASDGFGRVDIRVNENQLCKSVLDVCCLKAKKTTVPVIKPPILTSQECGFRNFDGIGFRIRELDNETQFGEFPWMAAVLEKRRQVDGEFNLYLCGGSLIHSRVVLTAAHCIAGKANNILKVRLGEWDTSTASEPLAHQDRDVVEVNIHENYQSQSLRNDIALMFLDSPITLAENVKTVCLPPPNELFNYRRCYVTGWGKDKFGKDGRYQVMLKKIDVPVVPTELCQNLLRTTRLGLHFRLHESFVCAGGEQDKDACRGDGGSPLICPIPGASDRYYQAGIVAWGVGCAQNNIPGVYVNVPIFRSWIDSSLMKKGYNQSIYTIN